MTQLPRVLNMQMPACRGLSVQKIGAMLEIGLGGKRWRGTVLKEKEKVIKGDFRAASK